MLARQKFVLEVYSTGFEDDRKIFLFKTRQEALEHLEKQTEDDHAVIYHPDNSIEVFESVKVEV